MAITTTLSRLKNYFLGWHTANYEILHELTENITNEDPDANRSPTSRAVYNYIKDLNADGINDRIGKIESTIGSKCTNLQTEAQNKIDTWNDFWTHICQLWNAVINEKNDRKNAINKRNNVYAAKYLIKTRVPNYTKSYKKDGEIKHGLITLLRRGNYVHVFLREVPIQDGAIGSTEGKPICNVAASTLSSGRLILDKDKGCYEKINKKDTTFNNNQRQKYFTPRLGMLLGFSYDECRWAEIRKSGEVVYQPIKNEKYTANQTITWDEFNFRVVKGESKVRGLNASGVYMCEHSVDELP